MNTKTSQAMLNHAFVLENPKQSNVSHVWFKVEYAKSGPSLGCSLKLLYLHGPNNFGVFVRGFGPILAFYLNVVNPLGASKISYHILLLFYHLSFKNISLSLVDIGGCECFRYI